MRQVGIVSMGAMGRTIASSMIAAGHVVHWSGFGRSESTVVPAREMVGTVEHPSIQDVFSSSQIVFCIGRGGIAEDTIEIAAELGYKGIYVDGNNLHGEASELHISRIADSANVEYVEALFRGYPLGYDQGGGEDVRNLYLSGNWKSAKIVELLFSDGLWKTHICPESAKSLNRTKFGRLF